VCGNGVDSDCDGLSDDQDPDCGSPGWGAASKAEASGLSTVSTDPSSLLNSLTALLFPLGVLLTMRMRKRAGRNRPARLNRAIF
jgi:hypothetical protein